MPATLTMDAKSTVTTRISWTETLVRCGRSVEGWIADTLSQPAGQTRDNCLVDDQAELDAIHQAAELASLGDDPETIAAVIDAGLETNCVLVEFLRTDDRRGCMMWYVDDYEPDASH